jgi:hypothetical protein
MKRLLPAFLILMISYAPLTAQHHLMKGVTIAGQQQVSIAHLLEKLSGKQEFSFAYNNKIVPADSLVSLSGYSGTLLGLLEKILGENYEFKEVPGYVVLRYAPRKLFITAEAYKNQGVRTIIRGNVSDASDLKAVARASVYERNQLLSTFTDDHGYFELKLKNYNGPVLLTVSKEDYRDTSAYILPFIIVNEKGPVKSYKYYPDNASGSDVEHNRLARIFISSRQLLQGLNLGNFFVSSPYQVSLTPGLSTHGLYNSQVVDHLSFNLLGGYTAGIDGLELAGLFNINRKDMRSTQLAGVFNLVGGSVNGVQLAGIYNRVLNHLNGLQMAGIANKTNQFNKGLQLAGVANINQRANAVHGAGLINTAVNSRGLVIAGLTNIARDSSNIQLAGLMNKSGHVSFLQAAGLLNIAKKVSGIQVGFINFADSSDYSFGLINFIKNGEKSVGISTDESFFIHADLRSGGRLFYGLIGVAFQPAPGKNQYMADIGIGSHLINKDRFALNAEYTMTFNTNYHSSSFRLLPGFKVNNHWVLFAGPYISKASADLDHPFTTNGWILSRSSSNTHLKTIYTGITGGIQYRWH